MRKKKTERGATILESLICIMLLCLIFFGLMQIFQWSMAQMLTEYSSFYAAKAYSLGYSRAIVDRASRVAVTGASGEDISGSPVTAPFARQKLSDAAEEYMSYGQYGPCAINYEYWIDDYWHNKSKQEWKASSTPVIYVDISDTSSDIIQSGVTVINMPLLAENLSWVVGGATEANPTGEASTFNHASLYLENH